MLAETLLLACVREVPNLNTGSKTDCYSSFSSYDSYPVRAANSEKCNKILPFPLALLKNVQLAMILEFYWPV